MDNLKNPIKLINPRWATNGGNDIRLGKATLRDRHLRKLINFKLIDPVEGAFTIAGQTHRCKFLPIRRGLYCPLNLIKLGLPYPPTESEVVIEDPRHFLYGCSFYQEHSGLVRNKIGISQPSNFRGRLSTHNIALAKTYGAGWKETRRVVYVRDRRKKVVEAEKAGIQLLLPHRIFDMGERSREWSNGPAEEFFEIVKRVAENAKMYVWNGVL